MSEIKKFKISKLPRKLKKKLYGTKGNRKHLCLIMIENKKFSKKFIDIITKTAPFTFEERGYKMIQYAEKQDFIWNIQTINTNENN